MIPDLPRLYIIRHGETEWSLNGRHTGTTDLPLTKDGERRALELHATLSGVPFSRVMTSPMLRARRTCALAGLARKAEIVPDLSEWDYGDYEGRASADIHRRAPGWDIYRDGCPGGESPARVSGRADRLIARLLALKGTIALFSHGQFGCALAARWIGLDIGEGVHFTLDPGSVSILGPKAGHPRIPALIRWNAGPSASGSMAPKPGIFSPPEPT